MEKNKIVGLPFIYKNNYFYYDTNKNNILAMDKDVFKQLNLLINGDESVRAATCISHLMHKGYFGKTNIKKIELLDYDSLKSYVYNCASQVILQVTKNCNMRCRYCTYAGDGFYDRCHTKTNMSWEVASKALNLFLLNSQDTNEITISFYGGEPLLCFDLIKQAILYSETVFSAKDITFTLTTNGVLLDIITCTFLKKHNVYVTVSLDGPKDIDDRFRKFPNGVGAFDIVNDHLLDIAKVMPEYYKNNISINSVITPISNIDAIRKHFLLDMNIDAEKLSLSNINLEGIDLIFDDINYSEYYAFIQTEKNNVYDRHKKIYEDKSLISDIYHHSGPCIPVAKKLFVSTEGKFYPCEKICERNEKNCIGDILNGLNLTSIYNMVNIGNYTREQCNSCWAIRFCNICIADIEGKNETEIAEVKKAVCEQKKRNILNSLHLIIEKNQENVLAYKSQYKRL